MLPRTQSSQSLIDVRTAGSHFFVENYLICLEIRMLRYHAMPRQATMANYHGLPFPTRRVPIGISGCHCFRISTDPYSFLQRYITGGDRLQDIDHTLAR